MRKLNLPYANTPEMATAATDFTSDVLCSKNQMAMQSRASWMKKVGRYSTRLTRGMEWTCWNTWSAFDENAGTARRENRNGCQNWKREINMLSDGRQMSTANVPMASPWIRNERDKRMDFKSYQLEDLAKSRWRLKDRPSTNCYIGLWKLPTSVGPCVGCLDIF